MSTDRRVITAFIDKAHARFYRRGESLGHPTDSLVRNIERSRKFSVLKGINKLLKVNMVDIYNNDLFEIYTCNDKPINEGVYAGSPAGSVSGWEIKWVLAPNKKAIKQYPFFDCIISKNDNSTGQAIDAELFIP